MLLYSEGFRLGGNNAPRAAATGVLPFEYKPDKLQELRGRVSRASGSTAAAASTSSLFFMQWDDIQLNTPASPTAGATSVVAARHVQRRRRPSRRASRSRVGIGPTDNFSIDASAFLADPEFLRGHDSDPDERPYDRYRKGRTMPISPDQKYYVAGRVHDSGNSLARTANSRGSHWAYSCGGLQRTRSRCLPRHDDRKGAKASSMPSWSTTHAAVRLHAQQRLGDGADRPQPVRRTGRQLAEHDRLRRRSPTTCARRACG